MNIDECYCLGRITKPWGVKGQLVLFLDVDTPEEYLELDSAFVEVKGQLVPHFFHIDQLNGNKAVATFEELTPEQANALVGHELYLPLSLLLVPVIDEVIDKVDRQSKTLYITAPNGLIELYLGDINKQC